MHESFDGGGDEQWLPANIPETDTDPETDINPYYDYEADEAAGDMLPAQGESPDENDDAVVPYAADNAPAVTPQDIVPALDVATKSGIIRFIVGDNVVREHHYTAPTDAKGDVDVYRLTRSYTDNLRSRGMYPREVGIESLESEPLARYRRAEGRLGHVLRVTEHLTDKANTPVHIFRDPHDVDAVMHHEFGKSWRESGGIYTPTTGILWVRSPDSPQLQSGLARMVVESSAAVVAIQRESNRALPSSRRQLPGTTGGNPQPAQQDQHIRFEMGVGYERPDIMTRPDGVGFHRAVTDMITLRVMREGGFRGAPTLSVRSLNIVLDGVIQEAARRTGDTPSGIANDIAAGYFSGNLHGLERLGEVYGVKGLREIMSLTGRESLKDITAMAKRLHIPQIGQAYRQIESAKPAARFHVYDWWR